MALKLLYDSDAWDAATITSSSEVGDLVDDNVVNDYVGRPWRTTGCSAEWAKFDLGSAKLITCLGIFKHNLTADATVTLEGNATDSWATPTYSDVLPMAVDADSVVLPRIVTLPAADNTLRWWRITIADVGNAAGYVSIGRIKAGSAYTPTRTYSDGASLVVDDPSEGVVVPGTLAPARDRTRYRTAVVQMRWIDRTQQQKLATMFAKVGRRTPIVACLRPDEYPTVESMYCVIDTPMSVVRQMCDVYHTGSIRLVEVVD